MRREREREREGCFPTPVSLRYAELYSNMHINNQIFAEGMISLSIQFKVHVGLSGRGYLL